MTYDTDEQFDVQLRDDDIVYIQYPMFLTIENLNEIIAEYQNTIKRRSYTVILDIKKTKTASIVAREELYKETFQKGIKACAVLTRTKIQEVLYNTFTTFNKTNLTIKMFFHEEKAIEWLEQFK